MNGKRAKTSSTRTPHAHTRTTSRLGALLHSAGSRAVSRLPAGILARIRLAHLIFALLISAGFLVNLSASQRGWVIRAGALAALMWAASRWLSTYRRERLGMTVEVSEFVALVLIGAATNPMESVMVAYAGLAFRSFYGSLRRALCGAVVYFSAVFVTVAMAGSSGGGPNPVPAQQAFSMTILAAVLHLVARTLMSHQRAATRESVLSRVGVALIAARTREEVCQAAAEAAVALAGSSGGPALVAEIAAGETVVMAESGKGLEQEHPVVLSPLQGEFVESLRQLLTIRLEEGDELREALAVEAGRDVLAVPVTLHRRLWGILVLAIGSEGSWQELDSALGTLSSELAMALESLLLVQERERSEARFRSLVQNSSDLTMVCDARGVLTYVSPASRRILGIDDASILGGPVDELTFPGEGRGLAERIRELASHGDGGGMLECQMRHGDGSSRGAEITVTNLLEDPSVRGIVLNVRDVTDRHRLEAELRHAQKLESVGQLAGGIAHEINTPIQFVGDNLRFLRDAFGDLMRAVGTREAEAADEQTQVHRLDQVDTAFLEEEVPVAIDQTLEGVERVGMIVRAMKAFGHPAGERKSPTDLNQAVRNTLVVANNEMKYVADVVTELGELPAVWCHGGDINQVLLNLVVNAAHAVGEAVKGTDRRGTITVRTLQEDDEVVMEVADTGVGIAPEIAGRVFDPFFTTKEVGKGTGQGLAVAYSLVRDRHNGTISFRSEPGAGTTFTVRLPIGPDTEHAEVPVSA